jgi:CRISPR-associated protein Csb2
MLVITVELLHGTIRATSSDDLAVTGAEDHGDWPPSPARLFSALVAADGTRDRCRVTDGRELLLFEAAAPPRIHADDRDQVLESPLRERYVTPNSTSDGTVQEYPGRTATLVRLGVRLAPRDPRVAYVWQDINPTQEELEALRLRAWRVGYLGCADSPVRLCVADHLEPGAAPESLWVPDVGGDVNVPVPFPGILETLDGAFDAWSSGVPVRRSWSRVELARYRSPSAPHATALQSPWATTLWLRLDPSVSGRWALRVAETLKAAVLDRLTNSLGVAPEAMSPLLHGHVDETTGYHAVQWITLPNVGGSHADGRLHGAAIMLPKEGGPEMVASVRSAIRGLHELHLPGGEAITVRVHAGERSPWAANPHRWTGPSRRWVSALPVVHERRCRGEPTRDEVALWCSHAGLPPPVWVWTSAVPLLAGAVQLAPSEIFRDREGSRRPYSHLVIEFAEPVAGPVVLGRARQFGIGLMAPDREGAS